MNDLWHSSPSRAKKTGNAPKIILIAVASVLFVIMTFISLTTLSNIYSSMTLVPYVSPTSKQNVQCEELSSIPAEKGMFQGDEIRGIYIASVLNINFPSAPSLSFMELKAELDDIISTCFEANLNTIYFQVRPSADALYTSNIFPTSEYLTGTQGSPLPNGFDPLEYLIEKSHELGIKVHAWVNPFRVTVGSPQNPKHDVTALAQDHPARLNPSYVIAYGDGKLYFDCGIPEVRALIADGVHEIVSNYNVDGVIFDDYFYPYPVYDKNKKPVEFDDSASYNEYGGEMSLDDWRRSNVNKTVEDCYNAVKSANEDCEFGIAPFGIWQNDNGSNNGSDTSGLESFSAIYCDPLAWIEGKYIDYIAPQIYWQFEEEGSRYDELVRWWNKQLDGSDVELLISHGTYKYDEWESPENEMRCQIEFARSQLSYKGSILYGYEALKNNSHGLMDEIKDVFSEERQYPKTVSNGRDLIISIPYSGSYIDGEGTFVIGASDHTEPLFIDGKAVGRTKSGYFSVYLPLEEGENRFTFKHKDKETVYVINRGTPPDSSQSENKYSTLTSPGIAEVSPSSRWAGSGILKVSVTAPRGSTVTAKLDGKTISLSPTLHTPYTGEYMKEVYTGNFTLKANNGEIRTLGAVEFTSSFGGETYHATSGEIMAMGKNAYIPVEVLKDDTEMKIAYDSWYYDDYTPQSAGMRDNAASLSEGMYKLRCGGLVSENSVKELSDTPIDITPMKQAFIEWDTGSTYFKIKVSENLPVNCYIENGEFCVTVYNTKTSSAPKVSFKENPLFNSVRGEKSAKANSYKYFFKLHNIENFYGFDHYYEDGFLIFKFRNPQALPIGDKPLKDKVIVLDAGHGGKNPGALGPLGSAEGAINESDFNLKIVLETEKYLTELGATVVLIRDENCEIDVPIEERLLTLTKANPDIVISVHQNSMPYTADVTKIHGCVGLYWSDAGYMLTDAVGEAVSTALNKIDRSPTKQRLAMVRNQKFPATLIETCFITNVEEYERMMMPDAVQTIAKAIANGVISYYNRQEKYIIK